MDLVFFLSRSLLCRPEEKSNYMGHKVLQVAIKLIYDRIGMLKASHLRIRFAQGGG